MERTVKRIHTELQVKKAHFNGNAVQCPPLF
jgi:hypothetical protein